MKSDTLTFRLMRHVPFVIRKSCQSCCPFCLPNFVSGTFFSIGARGHISKTASLISDLFLNFKLEISKDLHDLLTCLSIPV
jgi:hypothetical protein